MSKRRPHSPEFKARVARKPTSGGKTIQEIIGPFGPRSISAVLVLIITIFSLQPMSDTASEQLGELIEALRQEAGAIQIQGRALTPEEKARLEAIHQALPLLMSALEILTGGAGATPPKASMPSG